MIVPIFESFWARAYDALTFLLSNALWHCENSRSWT